MSKVSEHERKEVKSDENPFEPGTPEFQLWQTTFEEVRKA